MNAATAKMINEWIAQDGGNVERTAQWMAYSLRIGSIGECRKLIAEAQTTSAA